MHRTYTDLTRTVAFAVLYALATYVGRLTVMDTTNLSLVWPAAGVGAVWFVAQRRSRLFWLDVSALALVTVAINTATGAPAALAGWFVAANVAQAGLFGWLFHRWLPDLWGGGGARAISKLTHLWRLLAIAAISTTAGACIGPTGVWAVSGTYSWAGTAVWLTRNTVSMMLIGAAGLRIGYLLHQYWTTNPGCRRSAFAGAWRATPTWHRLEYVAVTLFSVLAYVVAFGLSHGLPLAFPLLVMTVWAALRLHTTFVIAHDVGLGTIAVLFTLAGLGPFAGIASNSTRALIVQLFVGVVAVVGLAVALGRDERDALMAELRDAQLAAAQQAQILGSVVDSMAEGLAVIAEDGSFLLRNPAAAALLGGIRSETGKFSTSEFYGLYRPDGTHIPAGELPFRRALDTGEPHDMDVIVRNAALAEDRVLAVRASVIPGLINGRRYAVSVFSDVTADRRHRDELTSFAGVVAHDLINPLATVEGWSEELAHVPDAADGIARIQRAAGRMRALITDLLAYTTSRDGRLQPDTVSLTDMVADIAAARVDQAQSNGQPVPSIAVRDLSPIHADAALTRQLLDNLISNAIKYTAPGVTPHITVTGSPVEDDTYIRIDIADNGIGIPTGQHDAVFNNFHRAHRTEGYAGTGLGLAICKRIVERHGGLITAAHNPAGPGTLISFTLPAATRRSSPRPVATNVR
nr:ATP-binding protein [Actinoplanes abujensis]